MKSRRLGRDPEAQKEHWIGGPQSSILPPRTLSSFCLQFPGYVRVGGCSRSDTRENFPPLCVLVLPPPFNPRTRFSRESAHPARGRRAGADGRLLSPRAATVPAASSARAAPPPSYDLPVSAAAARAQRSHRGQNCNLLSNG